MATPTFDGLLEPTVASFVRCFSTEAAQSTVVSVLTGTRLSGVVVVVVVVVDGVLTGTRLTCVVVVVIPLALCRPCLLLGRVVHVCVESITKVRKHTKNVF